MTNENTEYEEYDEELEEIKRKRMMELKRQIEEAKRGKL